MDVNVRGRVKVGITEAILVAGDISGQYSIPQFGVLQDVSTRCGGKGERPKVMPPDVAKKGGKNVGLLEHANQGDWSGDGHVGNERSGGAKRGRP